MKSIFKVGDKIKVKEKFWKIEIGVDVSIHFDMKKLVGRTLEVSYVGTNGNLSTKQDDSKNDTHWIWDKNWIELYTEPSKEITWDTLKWKDVVINKNGNEQMVLDVRNDLLDLSYRGDFYTHVNTFHKKELQEWGFTIKQPTPTPETESEAFKKMVAEVKRVSEEQVEKAREAETIVEKLELTLDQIAEKIGVDVTNIKIKK